MKLIFIRHAEPDYRNDSLTEKGFREAEILAERTRRWKVDQFYCSPLGRAQATAAPTLIQRGIPLTCEYPREAPDVICPPDASRAIVYPWLRELHAPVRRELHPAGKEIPWDLTPEYLNEYPLLLDRDRWGDTGLMKDCDLKNQTDWICGRLDEMLACHGYRREGLIYRTDGSRGASNAYMRYDVPSDLCMRDAPPDEPVIVIFCHFGVMMTMISHLINTAPQAMLHGFFVPPASVTILSAEERTPGFVYFRVQTAGDAAHLREAGEPISYYGGFDVPFQE